MKKIEAEKFPLIRDYDFGILIASGPGQGVLLVPEGDLFVPKTYGFGELSLIPHLQTPFNAGLDLRISELMKILETENDVIFNSPMVDGCVPFSHKVIRKLSLHEIVRHVKVCGRDDSFNPKDILSKGAKYDETRVHSMNVYDGRYLGR